jgi:hypothetical protein
VVFVDFSFKKPAETLFLRKQMKMGIAETITSIKKQIPSYVKLVAVSKTKPNNMILEAYNSGQRVFGENKVQELVQKAESLPRDIEWHMIGHLQSNKVKYIAPFVSLIHGVDSLKLLQVINKEAQKAGRVIPCLLQVHIASEETKFGFSEAELIETLSSPEFKSLKGVEIKGLMGMASFTENQALIQQEFSSLKAIFDQIKQSYFAHDANFCELSMGMSGDFLIAIEQGSTMVRIGSTIFGERSYH